MQTNRIVAATLILSLLALTYGKAAAGDAAVGKPAPDFTLKTPEGKALTLSDLKGKRGVVLVFFATWCSFCMEEVPAVKAFVAANTNNKVLVYGVNIKQAGRIVEKFIRDSGVNYRILLDSEAAITEAYEVSGIPAIIGIDLDGVIRYRGHRMPEDDKSFIGLLTGASKKPLENNPKGGNP